MDEFKAKAKQYFKDAIQVARQAKADRQYHLLNVAIKDVSSGGVSSSGRCGSRPQPGTAQTRPSGLRA